MTEVQGIEVLAQLETLLQVGRVLCGVALVIVGELLCLAYMKGRR